RSGTRRPHATTRSVVGTKKRRRCATVSMSTPPDMDGTQIWTGHRLGGMPPGICRPGFLERSPILPAAQPLEIAPADQREQRQHHATGPNDEAEEAWHRDAAILGDRLDHEIRRVADVGQ